MRGKKCVQQNFKECSVKSKVKMQDFNEATTKAVNTDKSKVSGSIYKKKY